MSVRKLQREKSARPTEDLPLELVAQIAASLSSHAACKDRPDDEPSPQAVNDILVRASRRAVALVEHCVAAITERRLDRVKEETRAEAIEKLEAGIRMIRPDEVPPRSYGNELLRFLTGVAASSDPIPSLAAFLRHVSPLRQLDPDAREQIARLEAQYQLPLVNEAATELGPKGAKRRKPQAREEGGKPATGEDESGRRITEIKRKQQEMLTESVTDHIARLKADGLTAAQAVDMRDALQQAKPIIRQLQAVQNATMKRKKKQ